MPRYPDYTSVPPHLKAMLRAGTSDDAAAERYFHTPNKNLKGESIHGLINRPLGQKIIERFLYDLGNYLGVEDMDQFLQEFGKRK